MSIYFACGFVLPYLPIVSSGLKLIFLVFTHLFTYSVSLPFNTYLSLVDCVPSAILGSGARTVHKSENALLPRSQTRAGEREQHTAQACFNWNFLKTLNLGKSPLSTGLLNMLNQTVTTADRRSGFNTP